MQKYFTFVMHKTIIILRSYQVKEKSEGTFFSRLLLNIAKTQINKSEEPKVGASGSSVYADHSEVIQSAQKDKDQLKKLFSQKPNVASTQG